MIILVNAPKGPDYREIEKEIRQIKGEIELLARNKNKHKPIVISGLATYSNLNFI